MRPKVKKLIWIAPLALLGMVLFMFIGGQVVMLLWNWLAPTLFGLQQVTFWQALGLLVLCRILFGGFGGGGHRSHSGRRFKERMRERMEERLEEMTPEERERLRQAFQARGGQTTPLDSTPKG